MVEKFIQSHALPAYRMKQFNHAFYKEYISSFEELLTWPKELRMALESEEKVSRLKDVKIISSKRGDTIKVLFETENGSRIESVLMRHKDGRNTVCVSCQIGCPVGCVFCATGAMGWKGNLSADEIVDQILFFARMVKKDDEHISNIVFMGMGEPMLNLEEVEKALAIIHDEQKLGMSLRRVTVSSSGIIPQLQKFIDNGFDGRLALSLHAPNQKIRELIMPIAKMYPYTDVVGIAFAYANKTKRRVSFEYTLIAGINDSIEHARELSAQVKGQLIHINLIPYNPTKACEWKRPDRSTMEAFARVLEHYQIEHTLRVTMGDDIQAACGQLEG